MTTKKITELANFRTATIVVPALLVVAVLTLTGCSSTGGQPTDEASIAVSADQETNLIEQWGVEVVALRLTGAGYMLDFRYKVHDAEKAAELFERVNKPALIHNESGAKLEVPRPAKTGPLRPTNPPEAGRIYFILFSNPGVVQPGDEVTVQIGDFEAAVVVE